MNAERELPLPTPPTHTDPSMHPCSTPLPAWSVCPPFHSSTHPPTHPPTTHPTHPQANAAAATPPLLPPPPLPPPPPPPRAPLRLRPQTLQAPYHHRPSRLPFLLLLHSRRRPSVLLLSSSSTCVRFSQRECASRRHAQEAECRRQAQDRKHGRGDGDGKEEGGWVGGWVIGCWRSNKRVKPSHQPPTHPPTHSLPTTGTRAFRQARGGGHGHPKNA